MIYSIFYISLLESINKDTLIIRTNLEIETKNKYEIKTIKDLDSTKYLVK